jgi:hypothetical protein
VPALPSGDKQTLCCPRCGQTVCADPHNAINAAAGSNQPPAYDTWELDEELRHIERVLHAGKATKSNSGDCPDFRGHRGEAVVGENGTVPFGGQAARFDPPQAGLPARHIPRAGRPRRSRRIVRRRGSVSTFLTWSVLTLGTTSFACGGILLGWSVSTGRQELWSVGLPLALAGQIALLVGLVLQIDRLWHDNREAAAKLDDVDEQIHELKTTTMLLGASQGGASATFYSHLAGGAGPQLLLTDLKSQLDLLAMKIAREA